VSAVSEVVVTVLVGVEVVETNDNGVVATVVVGVVVNVVCDAAVVVVNKVTFDVVVDNGVEAFFDEHPAIPKVPKDIIPKVRKMPMNLRCLLCIVPTPRIISAANLD
jgi:hypothetical protein